MANVLPGEAKRGLARRIRARFVFVMAFALMLSVLIAILAILPTFISLRLSTDALSRPAHESEAAREDAAVAARASALVRALQPLTATSSPANMVLFALESAPDDLAFTSIIYRRGDNPRVVLSGISSRREAVSEYRDSLVGSGVFGVVDVPVAALVGTRDGRFTITLYERVLAAETI